MAEERPSENGGGFKFKYGDGVHLYEDVLYNSYYPPEILTRIKDDSDLDPRDIVLAAYPNSGSTWIQEIIHLINGARPKDMLKKSFSLDKVFPHLEYAVPRSFKSGDVKGFKANLDSALGMKSPRLIKTHLTSKFFERELEKGKDSAKFVIFIRNPKDTLVSYFHCYRRMKNIGFPNDWEQFHNLYQQKKLLYGDPIEYILSWCKYKDHPNVMFLKYEDMSKNIRPWMFKLIGFLNKACADRTVEQIIECTTFEAMKKRGFPHETYRPLVNEAITPFMRKGEVGDYRNYFTEEQDEGMDKLCMEKFESTSISFKECTPVEVVDDGWDDEDI